MSSSYSSEIKTCPSAMTAPVLNYRQFQINSHWVTEFNNWKCVAR